jgi:hypothetical protein
VSGQHVVKSRWVSDLKFKPIPDITNSVLPSRRKLAYLIKARWAG